LDPAVADAFHDGVDPGDEVVAVRAFVDEVADVDDDEVVGPGEPVEVDLDPEAAQGGECRGQPSTGITEDSDGHGQRLLSLLRFVEGNGEV
jgi:hypothetical protein